MKGEIRKHQKTGDKQPDWKGKATIFGDEWEIAVWIRHTREGKPYMSMKGQIGRDRETSWVASLFKNDGKSSNWPWDYYGKIRGREDIEIYGTNEKRDDGWVCVLRFEGDVPLISKDRQIAKDTDDVPF